MKFNGACQVGDISGCKLYFQNNSDEQSNCKECDDLFYLAYL